MTCRTLVAGCLASLASTLILAPPSAAQEGRDLLLPQPRTAVRADRLDFVEGVDAVHVAARSRDLTSSGPGPVGVAQAAVEVYSYDDNDFDGFYRLVDNLTDDVLYEMEFAQRFRLPESGTVEYAIACVARGRDDTSSDAAFTLSFYRGTGPVPTTLLAAYDVPARLEEPGTYTCFRITGAVESLQLDAGQVWVAVSWLRGTPPENTKLLAADEDGSGGARAFRARPEEGDDWENWQGDTEEGVYGIRLAVDHPDPDPEPDPTPDPPPDPDPGDPPPGPGYTDCVPATTPLVFDGGYSVRMCYETPDGTIGEARSGWSSVESGLLWFFNEENAEVLIKVLASACNLRNNDHVWVFVAPVTTLAFNLHVTDGVDTWTHRNRQGVTASTESSNRAFPCRN